MPNPISPDFDALWDYDHPAETEARFRELLPGLETAGAPDARLQLLTQIARAQGLQQHFSDAQATLDRVSAGLTENTLVARIRFLLERGRVYNSAGQSADACAWFRDAYQEANALQRDFYTIDALHMLAIADIPERQMEWNQQALALARQSTDPRATHWQGSLYNNIGWSFFDAGKYSEALAAFEDALHWREEQGKGREILIARWCIARTLRASGQPAAALQMQREIRAAWLAAGDAPDGYGSEEIAECLLALGREDEAAPFFDEAYARFFASGALADQPARLARIKSLGTGNG